MKSISAFGLNLPVGEELVAPAYEPPPARPGVVLDERGRTIAEHATMDGVAYTTRYAYADDGSCSGVLPPGSTQWLRLEEYVTVEDGVAHLANGVSEQVSFDPIGRPLRFRATARDGAPVLDLALVYDADGRIARIGGTEVAYDGDRVRPAATAELDEHGRPVRLRSARYEHDAEGRRTARRSAHGDTVYRYDGSERPVAVERDGETVVRYAYDSLGRRVRREANGRVTHLHYDLAGNLLAETDEQGRAVATYLCRGVRCLARIDGPASAPATEWYHLDHAGSAWAVTDADGNVVGRRRDLFDLDAPGPTMRRFRDAATGLFDFGARDLDPETMRFTTPDSYTFDADDPRLRADPRLDVWGGDGPQRAALRHWDSHPETRDRYDFCLGDPVNNVDLDGHSAWWFFLTIPSSLIWALPNTVIALVIVIANLIMELIGWIAWPFVAWARGKGDLTSYPWGISAQAGANPPNPFDLNDRNHVWFGFDASIRQGVPWAMFNGSFCSAGRAYTLGNVVFIEDIVEEGNDKEKNQRYVVPNDPDVQLTRRDSLRQHEMQHTFQYAYLGPFFHCMPLPPLIRLIENAIAHHDLTDRSKWWEQFDLGGGLKLTVGVVVFLLTIGRIKPEDVHTWINPSTWYQHIFPFRWVEIASQAVNFDNWFPLIGVYELDLMFGGGQSKSFFERDAGASSGDTYGTVIEVEEDEIYVGQFTRLVGADVRTQPGSVARRSITWSVTPNAPLPAGSPGADATPRLIAGAPNLINLDRNNTAPVQVVNGQGLYFHTTAPGTYSVQGAGSSGVGVTSETVKITVKDVSVGIRTDVFICDAQVITVSGDPGATYSARLLTNNSHGTLVGLGYTAGPDAGTDTIEILAQYGAAAGPFAKYGDNGIYGGFDWVVKTIDIVVKAPTITPLTSEIFVGETVAFTFDLAPQGGSSTALVPGSRYDAPTSTFLAGRGSIAAEQIETITFQYGCRTLTATVKVKPIVVTAAPATVAAGGTAQINVSGGTAPYSFEIAAAGTAGPSADATGRYTAGTTAAPAVDVITVTDRGGTGGRGTVSINVTP